MALTDRYQKPNFAVSDFESAEAVFTIVWLCCLSLPIRGLAIMYSKMLRMPEVVLEIKRVCSPFACWYTV